MLAHTGPFVGVTALFSPAALRDPDAVRLFRDDGKGSVLAALPASAARSPCKGRRPSPTMAASDVVTVAFVADGEGPEAVRAHKRLRALRVPTLRLTWLAAVLQDPAPRPNAVPGRDEDTVAHAPLGLERPSFAALLASHPATAVHLVHDPTFLRGHTVTTSGVPGFVRRNVRDAVVFHGGRFVDELDLSFVGRRDSASTAGSDDDSAGRLQRMLVVAAANCLSPKVRLARRFGVRVGDVAWLQSCLDATRVAAPPSGQVWARDAALGLAAEVADALSGRSSSGSLSLPGRRVSFPHAHPETQPLPATMTDTSTGLSVGSGSATPLSAATRSSPGTAETVCDSRLSGGSPFLDTELVLVRSDDDDDGTRAHPLLTRSMVTAAAAEPTDGPAALPGSLSIMEAVALAASPELMDPVAALDAAAALFSRSPSAPHDTAFPAPAVMEANEVMETRVSLPPDTTQNAPSPDPHTDLDHTATATAELRPEATPPRRSEGRSKRSRSPAGMPSGEPLRAGALPEVQVEALHAAPPIDHRPC